LSRCAAALGERWSVRLDAPVSRARTYRATALQDRRRPPRPQL
jgi:hypothetical protein